MDMNLGIRSLEEIRKEKIARSLEQMEFSVKEEENTGMLVTFLLMLGQLSVSQLHGRIFIGRKLQVY